MKNLLQIEKNNKEYHIPGYHYCGPGTKVTTRLLSETDYGKPINPLDYACMIHDIEYLKYAGNDIMLRKADKKLKEAASKLGGMSAYLIDKVFFFKALAEDLGFWSPSEFAQKLVKELSIDEQRLLGSMLYRRYVEGDKDITISDYFNINEN